MLDLLQVSHDLAELGFESRPLFLRNETVAGKRVLSFSVLNHTFEFGKNKNFHLNNFYLCIHWP